MKTMKIGKNTYDAKKDRKITYLLYPKKNNQ